MRRSGPPAVPLPRGRPPGAVGHHGRPPPPGRQDPQQKRDTENAQARRDERAHRALLPCRPSGDCLATYTYPVRLSTISKHRTLERGSPGLVHLGRRVRRLRNAAGLTQAEVAAPFSRAYVSAIEGVTLAPFLPARVLIAAALET